VLPVMPDDLFSKRCMTLDGVETVYRLFEPPGAAASDPLPLLLFLHGAGEAGSDGLRQTTVGIGSAVRRDPDRFPLRVLFPQASRGYGWRGFNLAAAVGALADVIASRATDADRLYLTGISMGGYGTWLLAMQQPERFAAIAPVCGGLDVSGAIASGAITGRSAADLHDEAAARIAAVPQWVFHGARDEVVPVAESRKMVAALERAGAEVRYTEYPEVRHDAWEAAYAEPQLIPWMLARRRLDELREG
jgi:predicted peptidase